MSSAFDYFSNLKTRQLPHGDDFNSHSNVPKITICTHNNEHSVQEASLVTRPVNINVKKGQSMMAKTCAMSNPCDRVVQFIAPRAILVEGEYCDYGDYPDSSEDESLRFNDELSFEILFE